MSLSTAKYVFAAVGLALLLGALLVCGHTASFVHRATRTYGTVIALMPRVSTDSSNTNGSINNMTVKYTYQPLVRFQNGAQQIQFGDSMASSPPAYHVGETVKVLYLESDPYDARIESFMSLWLVPLIFGALGAIFLTVGTGMIVSLRRGAGT